MCIHTPDLVGLVPRSNGGYSWAPMRSQLSMQASHHEIPPLTKPHSAFDNYFLQAQRVRDLVRHDFDRAFRSRNVLSIHSETNQGGVDVLVHPSAIRTAPQLNGGSPGSKSNLYSYLQDVLTVPASLAGLPALSIPVGLGEDGWPVGVSLVGQWGHEKTILNLGKVLGASHLS